ncbi:hypothetical protein BD560DRAFT_397314 [Blakeslea trispora]|nr:hypothetical protein BD560DRAFT_397314 [Blakeslea trispora]
MMEHQDKLNRRKILSQIEDWNLGVSLTGSLATEPCFVHQSVPEIGTIKELSKSQFSMATQSKWTENLVQSGVSNPYDTITIKSLSVCYTILNSSKAPSFLALVSQENQKRMHALSLKATAFVHMHQIARLTKEFEDDLNEAKGHWPLEPQKSWDKLCSIWTKYGFLWPEKLYLEFKQQDHKHLLDASSQDRDYRIWRAQLRPLYEFFPDSHHAERDFMISMIHYFTPLVLYGCPFRLYHMKTNSYLAKADNRSIQMLGSKDIQSSESLWTFQTTLTHAPFVFTDTKAWILPEDDGSTLLTKDVDRALHHSFLNPGLQLHSIEHSQLNHCPVQGWTLSILSYHPKTDAFIHFDSIIHQLKCLSDGDIITLSQDSLYLCAETLGSLETHTPLNGNSIESIPSLSSITSTSHRFDFSHLDPSASNSTQPTANSHSHSLSSPMHDAPNTIAYFERPTNALHDGKEYQWRIEVMLPWMELDTSHHPIDQESLELASLSGQASSVSFKSLSIKSEDQEPLSQWLDGNPKLYQIYHVSREKSSPISSSVQEDQFNTPEGSYRSISSLVERPDLSERRREKLPLQQSIDALDAKVPNDSPNQLDHTISVDQHVIPNHASLEPHNASPSLLMSEAEEFKREIQQTYQDNNKVYEAIYNNLFHFSTPSTFTSSGPIRYYDNEDGLVRHQRNSLLNSHSRSMNTTPHSKQSQYTSSSLIANLTPEEYLARKQLRENSFLLLVPQETKQQILLNAIKKSTLGHWFKSKKSDSPHLLR